MVLIGLCLDCLACKASVIVRNEQSNVMICFFVFEFYMQCIMAVTYKLIFSYKV